MSASFEPFGRSHGIMLAIFAAGIPCAVILGRAIRGNAPAIRMISRAFAVVTACVVLPLQIIDFLPGSFDLQTTLPLQLCDLAWMAAVVALWSSNRTAVAVTYYWGVSLTTQAMITPWLTRGFPDPKFIAFWAMHSLIVWAAIYLTWGLGRRPDWRGFRVTVAITLCWLVAIFCFNAVAGTNYGFVNRKPDSASVLDHLGPWPAYVVVQVVLVALVWALMTWPWTRAATRQPGLVAAE
jgi:hypothetical integral membrane protein (TIGR02206 family)